MIGGHPVSTEKSKRAREKRRLCYPGDKFSPEDFLNFVQWDSFVADWKSLGLCDDDLRALEVAIMAKPTGAPVVGGTGGLRKLRFAPAAWNKGKRGAVRVCYVYFEVHHVVLLLVAYGKTEQDNLTAAEKKSIKTLIEEISNYLEQR